MKPAAPGRIRNASWWGFLAGTLLVGAVYVLYGANIVAWSDSPNYGWRSMYSSGPNVVAEVFESGKEAGLRPGDRITAINGKPYDTFEELYFKIRNPQPGSANTYTVLRGGQVTEVRVVTGRLGFQHAFRRSGPIFLIGLVYFGIGILVYLMKPQARESLLFFVLSCLLGLEIGMGAPSDLMRPRWLFDVRLVAEKMLPAALIHLALVFPVRRSILVKRPAVWAVPYAASLLVTVLYKINSTAFWDIPRGLYAVFSLFLLLSVMMFMLSMLWNMRKGHSSAIRLQSRMIFVGLAIGLLVPVGEHLLRQYAGIRLFPDPAVGFAFFLIAFPMSIGYTIVKHDLFAIDVIVRRTYGYVLSTGAIVATYVLLLSGVNVLFRSEEISRSPLFSIGFALLAVFGFRPLHERIQALVDRAFYRQRYDYRKTIQSVSEAMTSILDPVEIRKLLIGSVVREMVLENGLLLLREPSGDGYAVSVVEGGGEEETPPAGPLPAGEEIVKVLEGRNAPVFRYDIELDPQFEAHRETLSRAFDAFRAESMMPLKYKDSMRGIVCLGRKKSGRLFTPEDVDLLKTITHQTAIALENAHLFEENLEKGRMEEELKIAHDIQVSMLPERAPEVEGLRIAARSIPAREVGGDFYDFVTMDGERGMGKVAVVVGDVSGKAVSGALVMAASRSVFRVLTEADASVGEVMNRMNYRLCRDVRKGMFVAALYALLDSREKTLTLANAGQTSPVLCPADGGLPVLIENEGDRFPLGIIEECTYEETRVSLNSGDIVVLYTDGVVEAVNAAGEIYGFERFLETAGKGRGLSADGLLETLLEDVARFVGGVEPHDDITVVVAKVQ